MTELAVLHGIKLGFVVQPDTIPATTPPGIKTISDHQSDVKKTKHSSEKVQRLGAFCLDQVPFMYAQIFLLLSWQIIEH